MEKITAETSSRLRRHARRPKVYLAVCAVSAALLTASVLWLDRTADTQRPGPSPDPALLRAR